MYQNEVAIAFDMVLEEIEDAIAVLNREGAQAFGSGRYDIARDLIEKGSQMTEFRIRVKDLEKEVAEYLCRRCASEIKKTKSTSPREIKTWPTHS